MPSRSRLIDRVPPGLGWDLLACGLLLVAALLLRLQGLDALLPHHPEADAWIVEQTIRLSDAEVSGETRQAIQGKYPLLLADVVRAIDGDQTRAFDANRTPEEHRAAASAPFLAARRVLALLSALAAPLTYLLARTFMERPAASLAGAWVATSLLHVSLSVQARPHAPLATFCVLTLLLAIQAARSRGPWWLIPLALASAFATGTLQSGALTILPAFLATALVIKRHPRTGAVAATISALLAIGILLRAYPIDIGAHAGAARPQAAIAEEVVAEEVIATSEVKGIGEEPTTIRLHTHRIQLDRFRGRGALVLAQALISSDPLLALLASLGALGLLRKGKWRPTTPEGWILASFAIPFAACFAAYDLSHPRFFVPLLPLVALFAAHGPARRLAAWGFLILSFTTAARFAWLRTQPDSLERTAEWIVREAAEEPTLVLAWRSLPLIEGRDELVEEDAWSRSTWERYQLGARNGDLHAEAPTRFLSVKEGLAVSRGQEGAALLAARLGDPAVTFVAAAVEPLLDDERSWNSIAMQEQVLAGAGARPVARIPESPWTAPGPYPTLTLRGWSALEVWRRRCLGPQIEIHRLPRR